LPPGEAKNENPSVGKHENNNVPANASGQKNNPKTLCCENVVSRKIKKIASKMVKM